MSGNDDLVFAGIAEGLERQRRYAIGVGKSCTDKVVVFVGKTYVSIGDGVDCEACGSDIGSGRHIGGNGKRDAVDVGHQRGVAHHVVNLPVVFFHTIAGGAGLDSHIAGLDHSAHREVPFVVGLVVRMV